MSGRCPTCGSPVLDATDPRAARVEQEVYRLNRKIRSFGGRVPSQEWALLIDEHDGLRRKYAALGGSRPL